MPTLSTIKKMRVRQSVQFSGSYPHREHRSKKGRDRYGSKSDREFSIRRKKQLEKLREKSLYD